MVRKCGSIGYVSVFCIPMSINSNDSDVGQMAWFSDMILKVAILMMIYPQLWLKLAQPFQWSRINCTRNRLGDSRQTPSDDNSWHDPLGLVS